LSLLSIIIFFFLRFINQLDQLFKKLVLVYNNDQINHWNDKVNLGHDIYNIYFKASNSAVKVSNIRPKYILDICDLVAHQCMAAISTYCVQIKGLAPTSYIACRDIKTLTLCTFDSFFLTKIILCPPLPPKKSIWKLVETDHHLFKISRYVYISMFTQFDLQILYIFIRMGKYRYIEMKQNRPKGTRLQI